MDGKEWPVGGYGARREYVFGDGPSDVHAWSVHYSISGYRVNSLLPVGI